MTAAPTRPEQGKPAPAHSLEQLQQALIPGTVHISGPEDHGGQMAMLGKVTYQHSADTLVRS